jgi:hypothetical protein
MAEARASEIVRDSSFHVGANMVYGPARLTITQRQPALDNQGRVTIEQDESILLNTAWDHSLEALQEAADAARRRGGRVFVGQDVFMWSLGSLGCLTLVGEGFNFEVWPKWTGEVST